MAGEGASKTEGKERMNNSINERERGRSGENYKIETGKK